MAPIPDQPGDLPDLNTTLQSIVTIALWAGTIALVLYAIHLSRRDRSPIAILLVLAVAVGSLIEPLYDISYHLFWHDFDANGESAQWTLFESFDLPQPVWVMPAYVVVFAGPAIFMYQGLAKGTNLRHVFKLAAITACTTAAFEILMINLDLYSYWSPQTMRVLDYPIWIACMEAAQITTFAMLVALLWRKATKPVHLLAAFLIFPANFAFSTLGAGFPGIIAINMDDPSSVLMFLGASASIALAAVELWWVGTMLIRDQDQQAELDELRAAAGRTVERPSATFGGGAPPARRESADRPAPEPAGVPAD